MWNLLIEYQLKREGGRPDYLSSIILKAHISCSGFNLTADPRLETDGDCIGRKRARNAD